MVVVNYYALVIVDVDAVADHPQIYQTVVVLACSHISIPSDVGSVYTSSVAPSAGTTAVVWPAWAVSWFTTPP